jgi:hypothetical protein
LDSTTALGTKDDRAYGVAIQSDGKILLAGGVDVSGRFDFGVIRVWP